MARKESQGPRKNKKSSKRLGVLTADVNWQDSGYKEPCLISTDECILTPPAVNRRFINEINNIFYSFLWNKKGDNINYSR